MQTLVTDLQELARVTLAALLFGAGLPAIFALGVRLQSRSGVSDSTDGAAVRRTAAVGAALCYAVVLATVVAGVLFVAKAFLASRLGIHLFGQ
ncbi:hypothetical protein NDR87_26065 [Nocardia sp. CDC159]|uniref:Uncharacterized protein n=1 Tax=Nocardia pulmonis TaxID=2951408 RepID=A0A9X2E5Y5_9NOCA|nr:MULTISPECIES: hypothetical protein [Nocardia]MCM6774912.1 hypothetical protein [Nocardia pulmonis]MCM6789843.1 hypothetical protein [Nocardia sp. CDC159]